MAEFKNLQSLFNPKSIAIIGASERVGSAGKLVISNLINLGYKGEIFPINPKFDEIMGLKSYKSLSDIGKPVEMVAILLGSQKVFSILEEMHSLGIKNCWCLASGFSESGEEGKALQKKIADYCNEKGILLVGPNCVGLVNLPARYAAYSVAINPKIQSGNVSAVMQSGAILMGLVNSANLGFRYLVSSGNQAVLDISDYIHFLASDEETKVILVFLEGIPHAEKFIEAIREAANHGKPILMLKIGKSEAARRTIQAHTGSLAGSDAVLDAILRKEGVIRLDTLDDLVETAKLFSMLKNPVNNGISMISLSGGQIGLINDLNQSKKVKFVDLSQETVDRISQVLPPYSKISNPLDAWGNGDLEAMYRGCLEALSKQPDIDLIAITRDTPIGVADREIQQSAYIAQVSSEIKENTGKEIILFSNFSGDIDASIIDLLSKHKIPYLKGTPEALTALKAYETCSKLKASKAPENTAENAKEINLEWKNKIAASNGILSEIEGRKLLNAYGIPSPKEAVAHTIEEAISISEEIGYPIVMKVFSDKIKHKTEFGGVKLGLNNREDIKRAYHEICQSLESGESSVAFEGVLLQKMVTGEKAEVILGMINDPDFGPTIVYGTGGILVELLKDSAIGIPPLSYQEAYDLIHSTKGVKLLQGFRNKPKMDIDALIKALMNFSKMVMDIGNSYSAIEINPLLILPEGQGVCAVDMLLDQKK